MLVKLGEGCVFIFNDKCMFAEILNTDVNNLVVGKTAEREKNLFCSLYRKYKKLRLSFPVGYGIENKDIVVGISGTFTGRRIVHKREENLPAESYCLLVYLNAF